MLLVRARRKRTESRVSYLFSSGARSATLLATVLESYAIIPPTFLVSFNLISWTSFRLGRSDPKQPWAIWGLETGYQDHGAQDHWYARTAVQHLDERAQNAWNMEPYHRADRNVLVYRPQSRAVQAADRERAHLPHWERTNFNGWVKLEEYPILCGECWQGRSWYSVVGFLVGSPLVGVQDGKTKGL